MASATGQPQHRQKRAIGRDCAMHTTAIVARLPKPRTWSWMLLATCAVLAHSDISAGGAAKTRKSEAKPQTAALAKPTSGTPQSAQPRAVCTFQCIGLYWTPIGGAEDKVCRVRYRPVGEQAWHEALPLWFDQRIGEYRGSIVQLPSDRTYEVRLDLAGGGPSATMQATTWREVLPIAKTIHVDDRAGKALTVNESGTPQGYVLYTHRPGVATATIDAADKVDQCVEVNASHVILRGLTLRSPRVHGIVLGHDTHDVVIEECDISGWGRIDKDGWGVDYDSAVYSRYRQLARVVIQRNRMHHPRSNSNTWQEFREGGGKKHPMGPQGISFFDSDGNHVFRYNEFLTDDEHFCNDIFGGGPNRSLRGFPGGDSDVYGNQLEGCWDDGLEIEGGGCNVRVWGNYIDRTMAKIAIAGVSVGPVYIFRNVLGSSRFGHKGFGGGPCVKMGGAPLTGGGRAYIFHNTILQPPGSPEARGTMGCAEGLSQSGGPELLSVVSRNNILQMRSDAGKAIRDSSTRPVHDYDYDLIWGMVVSTGKQEQHGTIGIPRYAAARTAGDFSLDPSSPGFDAGVVLPNFNDGFRGEAPDVGACEAGWAPLQFGIRAEPSRAARGKHR